MNKRRRHQPDFKARIAIEALNGLKPTAEIAHSHHIHPVQVNDWKRHLVEHSADVFGCSRTENQRANLELELERAQAKIGQLTLELDFLKKKSKQLGL
jgi:transposase